MMLIGAMGPEGLKEVSKYVYHSVGNSSHESSLVYYLVMQIFVYFLPRYECTCGIYYSSTVVMVGYLEATADLDFVFILCCISFWTGMFSVGFFLPHCFSLLSRFFE